MLWHVHGHQKITCHTSESFPPFPGEWDVLCGHKKKWSFYVFDSSYENWHGASQTEYFCMGSFLATQIDPGATIYNLRVQLWQGFWGFRPLYMWILVQKMSFFVKNALKTAISRQGGSSNLYCKSEIFPLAVCDQTFFCPPLLQKQN